MACPTRTAVLHAQNITEYWRSMRTAIIATVAERPVLDAMSSGWRCEVPYAPAKADVGVDFF